MDRLAAVRFNNVKKFYYFSTSLDLHKGDKVVVETVRGLELGEIIADLKDLSEFKLETELKPIKRLANRADMEIYEINRTKAEKSFEICKDIIADFGLEMRLINCEYTLDASKVIFMYTADERVDFRELLKKLASVFKCRIELNQIGPRDKAKIVGGIGNCGLPLCCASFLGEFDGVSINMAKNQLLAINIDKISGSCGRLLCCLKYEDAAYTEIKRKFPKIGSYITFEDKNVKVVGLNVISDLVKIDDAGSISFITLDEVKQGKHIEKVEKVEKVVPQQPKEKPNANKNQKKKQTKQPKKDKAPAKKPAAKKDEAQASKKNTQNRPKNQNQKKKEQPAHQQNAKPQNKPANKQTRNQNTKANKNKIAPNKKEDVNKKEGPQKKSQPNNRKPRRRSNNQRRNNNQKKEQAPKSES